jgi:hypothetical protein
MGLINDEPDSGSEACVTTLINGTEEGNIEVEEENPEGVINTPVQSEVSVWRLCFRQKHFMLPGSSMTTKTNSANTPQLSLCKYLAFSSSLSRPTIAHHIYINNKLLCHNITRCATFAFRYVSLKLMQMHKKF